MPTFNRADLARNLPDAYRKDSLSNNYKLMQIAKAASDRLRSELAALYDSLDIDSATGGALDLYGEMVGQARGAAADAQYRALIRAKISRNRARSDLNSVAQAIASALDCDLTEVIIRDSEVPCVVKVESLPFSVLNAEGAGVATTVGIIDRLMPVGVRLEAVRFAGQGAGTGYIAAGAQMALRLEGEGEVI